MIYCPNGEVKSVFRLKWLPALTFVVCDLPAEKYVFSLSKSVSKWERIIILKCKDSLIELPKDSLREYFNKIISSLQLKIKNPSRILDIAFIYSYMDMILNGDSYIPWVPLLKLLNYNNFSKFLEIENLIYKPIMGNLKDKPILEKELKLPKDLEKREIAWNIIKDKLWEKRKELMKEAPFYSLKRIFKGWEVNIFYIICSNFQIMQWIPEFHVYLPYATGFKVMEWKLKINENGGIIKVEKKIQSSQKRFNIFRTFKTCIWG